MTRVMIALLGLGLLVGADRATAQEFKVVVNAANPVAELSKREVADAFLKRGGKLVPVDLAATSPVRDAFSKAVHGRPAAAIVSHWQQQIFSGRDVPPAERGSDADVLAFVRANPDAIGYVASSTSLGDGVKAVTVR
jgi:ABC-type phosphate transport system substrate-binding protein